MRCEKCGNPMSSKDSFCSECGHKINEKGLSSNTEREKFSKRQEKNEELDEKWKAQNNNKPFNTNSKIQEQLKKVLKESKGFFKNAFTSMDEIIKSDKMYSFKLVFSLLIIGILIISLIVKMFIPSEVSSYIGTSGDILIGITLSLVVLIGATFAMTRLVVKKPVIFQKVLSDYVLVNSVTVLILLVSIFLFKLGTYKFSISLFTLSLLLFIISGAYLIGKYSSNKEVRVSSFYGVIIYMVIVFIFISIFGQSLYEHILGPFIEGMFENFGEYSNY
ncbi:zinc ribbon domain-containing protein [Micrococcus luteus]|uniref:zinc ribbon domain-containing protein n=1 Tax=Micrococcus luteus TaxID=1270 RepID=UPI0033E82B1B